MNSDLDFELWFDEYRVSLNCDLMSFGMIALAVAWALDIKDQQISPQSLVSAHHGRQYRNPKWSMGIF